ncbi:Rhodanese-like protein [Ascodesmis nigricans]|uniref:Sulfurtransferase n=1 Tax=Ascodesmis nigricans TaxID=341454 RepID=A0A4S2MVP8_9PEZI|nr:Rhodanese-like protein [Ascodesmis nigricans]
MAALRRSLLLLSAPRANPQPVVRRFIAGLRFNSNGNGGLKRYSFEDIKALSSNPSPTRYLIDVREPHEFTAGYIPGAINLPIASSPDALLLPEEEFEERYGISKPDKAKSEVVFYCKAGIRSHSAAELARQAGYEKVAEYPGSWNEWVERSKQ